MFWQFYVLLILIFVWMVRRRNRNLTPAYAQVKSDVLRLPLIGHAYKFFGNDEAQMKTYQYFGREAIRRGGCSSIWIGNLLIIVLVDAVDVEFVTRTCMEKGVLVDSLRATTGNGSIFAPVSIWRPRRKILLPTFSSKNLLQFGFVFSKQSSIMADQLEARVGKGPFSIWHYLTTYSMDAVCETTLGMELRTQTNHAHPFYEHFEMGSEITASRIVRPWQHSDALFRMFPNYYRLKRVQKFLRNFFTEIILAKRKELKIRAENNSFDEDNYMKPFLELLIEASGCEKSYTDEELLEEIQVLVMAGTDTSAVGAAFTALMLARHPDVQEKVYEELKEVFGASERPVHPDDLPRLKYLEHVVKESLRLYPPVPLVARHADEDLTLPSGVSVTKGNSLLLNIWAIHRNPRYWGDDAEEFRPERWLKRLKHPAQFMLFSYGPRNCAGYRYAMQSMKTALSTILRRYRILPAANPAANPAADPAGGAAGGQHAPLRLKYGIMMKDVDNFTVQLEKRI